MRKIPNDLFMRYTVNVTEETYSDIFKLMDSKTFWGDNMDKAAEMIVLNWMNLHGTEGMLTRRGLTFEEGKRAGYIPAKQRRWMETTETPNIVYPVFGGYSRYIIESLPRMEHPQLVREFYQKSSSEVIAKILEIRLPNEIQYAKERGFIV
jgi:hypothetical protein